MGGPSVRARDVMRRPPIAVRPDDDLRAAAETMLQFGVDGLPVVADDGRLVGMVGIKDVLRAPHPSDREVMLTRYDRLAVRARSLHRLRVADVMARRVVSVTEATPLAEVVALLVNRGRHPIPVLRDGVVLGVIGRADALRALLALAAAPPSLDDDRAE